MAANETLINLGTWATLQAAASTADGAFSAGTRTVVSTALSTGNEADWPLLDLKLAVSVGTPAAAGTVDVYLRGKADTDEEPAPDATDLGHSHFLGSFVMHDTAASEYYLYGVPNLDKSGTLYLFNNDGVSTLTIALSGRARGFIPSTS